MRASIVLQLTLLFASLLHVAVAQFPLPFPFGGAPMHFGAHFPIFSNEHHEPAPNQWHHPPHPPHPNIHYQGKHNQFEVLHTNEQRTEHDSNGDRLHMGTQRTIGRQMKYDHDNKYGKAAGNGAWNMFGHEVQYGEKEQMRNYFIPKQPIQDKRHYEMEGGHKALRKIDIRDDYNQPKMNWNEEGSSYDVPSKTIVTKKPVYYYEQPVINYERKGVDGNKRFTVNRKPMNHKARVANRSPTPTIGKPQKTSKSHDNSVNQPSRKVLLQKPRLDQTYYRPVDNNYKHVNHQRVLNDYSVITKSKSVPTTHQRRWYHNPEYNKNHYVENYFSHNDQDYHYPDYISTLLDEGWEEVDPTDPIIGHLIYNDDYTPILSNNHGHYHYNHY